MESRYPLPNFFVTVSDQPASCAVMALLPGCLSQYALKDESNNSSRIKIADCGDELITAWQGNIAFDEVVALFDAGQGRVKRFKPLHGGQLDASRPSWVNYPLWAVKINTRQANSDAVIRQCAYQVAAW